MTRSEKEKMLAGELYRPGDAEIQADQAATKKWLVRYNASLGLSAAERRLLLAERMRIRPLRKKPGKRDDPEQSKAFIKAARELGTDNGPERFEETVRKVAQAAPTKSARKAKPLLENCSLSCSLQAPPENEA